MASRSDGKAVSAEELGRQQEIPHGFLQAILADLRRAGIVMSQRGQSGGWRMGRPADDVSVADVIRAVDGPLVSVYGLRPEAVSTTRPPRCSSTCGSPRAGRCATSSSRSRSSSSPTASCPRRSPHALRTKTPGSRTDRLRSTSAELASSFAVRLHLGRRRSRTSASVEHVHTLVVRRACRVGRARARPQRHQVAQVAGARRTPVRRRPWPSPRRDRRARRGPTWTPAYSAISRSEAASAGTTRPAGSGSESRSASKPTSNPSARHATVASAGSVTTTCSRSGLLVAAAQRASTLPRSSSSGNSPTRPSGTPASTTTCTCGAGQPVDQQRDLVSGCAGEQLVADDDGLPLLEGPAADRAQVPSTSLRRSPHARCSRRSSTAAGTPRRPTRGRGDAELRRAPRGAARAPRSASGRRCAAAPRAGRPSAWPWPHGRAASRTGR